MNRHVGLYPTNALTVQFDMNTYCGKWENFYSEWEEQEALCPWISKC